VGERWQREMHIVMYQVGLPLQGSPLFIDLPPPKSNRGRVFSLRFLRGRIWVGERGGVVVVEDEALIKIKVLDVVDPLGSVCRE
jgi:hypothetical protein